MVAKQDGGEVAMTHPKLRAEYVNAKDGVAVRVHEYPDGWSVTVRDIDAGLELPDTKMFLTRQAAEIYAMRCAF